MEQNLSFEESSLWRDTRNGYFSKDLPSWLSLPMKICNGHKGLKMAFEMWECEYPADGTLPPKGNHNGKYSSCNVWIFRHTPQNRQEHWEWREQLVTFYRCTMQKPHANYEVCSKTVCFILYLYNCSFLTSV